MSIAISENLAGAAPRRVVVSLSSLLFFLLILNYVLGGIGSVIRLRYGDLGPLTTGFQPLILPLIVFVALTYLVSTKSCRLSFLSGMLCCLFLYGAVVGILHNQMGGAFISHSFHAIFAIVLFVFGRTLQGREPEVMRQSTERLAKWVLLAHIPILAAFFIFYSTGAVYFGMSAGILLISIIAMWHAGRRGWAMLAIILLISTGKRGDLLGLIMAFLTYASLAGRIKNLGRIFGAIIGVVLAMGGLLFAAYSFLNIDLLNDFANKMTVLSRLDLSQLDSHETRMAIGGRGMEIFVTYDALFTHGLANLLMGLGFGWSLRIDMATAEFNATIHNVHITPFNTVAQYGLALAAVWWFGVLKTIANGYSTARSNPALAALVPYAVGTIAVTMTAYAISVDPLFWIVLGAISVPVYSPRGAHPARVEG